MVEGDAIESMIGKILNNSDLIKYTNLNKNNIFD